MWPTTSLLTENKILILFYSFNFIFINFIIYKNHHHKIITNLDYFKLNRSSHHHHDHSIIANYSDNQHYFNESSTSNSTVRSKNKNKLNSSTTSNNVTCAKETITKFHQQAIQTTLTLEERKYLYETIALFTSELDKNHIDYITIGGSLLGIIRHGGLIPYDDDFDIAVLEEDRSRVIEMMAKLNHSTLTYRNQYLHPKVFINRPNCHRPKGLNFCYPYVDMFYLKTNRTHWSFVDFYAIYAIKDIYPRKRANFNHIPVWIPNKWVNMLTSIDVLTTCCSGWLHKHEASIRVECLPCVCLYPNLTLAIPLDE